MSALFPGAAAAGAANGGSPAAAAVAALLPGVNACMAGLSAEAQAAQGLMLGQLLLGITNMFPGLAAGIATLATMLQPAAPGGAAAEAGGAQGTQSAWPAGAPGRAELVCVCSAWPLRTAAVLSTLAQRPGRVDSGAGSRAVGLAARTRP